ncbi:hypothetical protein FNF27_05364 [Cafeteria roenbergensis]|uniref:Glyoxalase/fosfomycin resistance/dioxygenase domain-containing protein n=1 Tax=Cafeteria roenbergensis TaxID=33653 RepID=A0A5A8EB36_CAFRO|nr:hypothetical protein FNF27_05364 [Cafeteria roenbergensis]
MAAAGAAPAPARDEDRAASLELTQMHIGPKGSIASPDGAKHIKFLSEVFGAKVLNVWPEDSLTAGKPIVHATLWVNNGVVYLFDASTFETGAKPHADGVSCAMALNIELDSPEEAKRVFAAAIAAGATEATELKLHFWQSEGSLFGAVRDPWGFRWTIDFESAEQRKKYGDSLAKQIAEARAAEAKPVGRD